MYLFQVVEISLQGSGFIDNLTLSSSEHLSHFYDAAEWFVNHQDPNTGGWVNPVRRKLAAGLALLDPGWYVFILLYKLYKFYLLIKIKASHKEILKITIK